MKKYLFMAIAAVTALAFSSCKDENNNPTTDDVTITFAKKTIELSVGEEVRLGYTVAPVGAEIQQLKFVSSDASVATVSASGVVSAIAEGEAQIIVSAEGAKGDTCYILVSDDAIYNQFNIADWGLFGKEWNMIPGTDTTLTWPDGTKYDVQLGEITLLAWDGNVAYSSEAKAWAGAGLVIEVPVTFWVITKAYTEDTQGDVGAYIGHGGFDIYDLKGKMAHGAGQAGAVNVNDYGDFLKSLIAAETSDDVMWDLRNTAFTGAKLLYFDYTNPEEPSYSDSYGQYYGHITQCIYYDANKNKGTEAAWACKIAWHDFLSDDRYFGLKVTRDEEGYLASVIEPYDFKEVERTLYSENWEEVLAQLQDKSETPKLGDPQKIHHELPSFGKYIKSTDRLYKK